MPNYSTRPEPILDKYANIGYIKMKNFILGQNIFDQPVDMKTFFDVVSFQIIKSNMYGDLDKLSYIVNSNHPTIKLVMDNINRVLQHFSIFKNEGINFNIKKQYVDKKSNYVFTNVKFALAIDEGAIEIIRQVKGHYEFKIEMEIKQNNDKYIKKELVFTPMLLIVNDSALTDASLAYIYKHDGLVPMVDLEIQIPQSELDAAVFMKEMTNCLFYAMVYNGYNIENNQKVNELKVVIKNEIKLLQGEI